MAKDYDPYEGPDLVTRLGDALEKLVKAAQVGDDLRRPLAAARAALARRDDCKNIESPPQYLCDAAAVVYDQYAETYGPESVRVAVAQEAGVRLLLGSPGNLGAGAPDVLVERQKGRWLLFIHPESGGDPSCYVYVRDDGKVFVQPEVYSDAKWVNEKPGPMEERELEDGSVIEAPDEEDVIRRRGDRGAYAEARRPGEPGYEEWLAYFPDRPPRPAGRQ